ncbi:MAG: hypothetical protein GTO41_27335 [Burkholderiales bacterium]|nr:hypothetical protein [Burkholderiales bacterium]
MNADEVLGITSKSIQPATAFIAIAWVFWNPAPAIIAAAASYATATVTAVSASAPGIAREFGVDFFDRRRQ